MQNRKKLPLYVLLFICALVIIGCGNNQEKKYQRAQNLLLEQKYDEAIELFDSISTYGNSAKYSLYAKALKAAEIGETESAVTTFASLGDFADSSFYKTYYEADLLSTSQEDNSLCAAEEMYQGIPLFLDSQEKAKELANIIENNYEEAIKLIADEDYEKAIDEFQIIFSYKDSTKYITYTEALIAGRDNNIDQAISLMGRLDDFEDALHYKAYFEAKKIAANGDYDSLVKAKAIYLDNASFLDCNEQAKQIDAYFEEIYTSARTLLSEEKYDEALSHFAYFSDYKDSEKYITYIYAIEEANTKVESGEEDLEDSINTFSALGNFEKSEEYIKYCNAAILTFKEYAFINEIEDAVQLLESISGTLDVSDLLTVARDRLSGMSEYHTYAPEMRHIMDDESGTIREMKVTSSSLTPFVAGYSPINNGETGDYSFWICLNEGKGIEYIRGDRDGKTDYCQKYYIPGEPINDQTVSFTYDNEGTSVFIRDDNSQIAMIDAHVTISGPQDMSGFVFYNMIDDKHKASFEDGVLIPNLCALVYKGEGSGLSYGSVKYKNLIIENEDSIRNLDFQSVLFVPLQEIGSDDYRIISNPYVTSEKDSNIATAYTTTEKLKFDNMNSGLVAYKSILVSGGESDRKGEEKLDYAFIDEDGYCTLEEYYYDIDWGESKISEPKYDFEVLGVVSYEQLGE